jgi:hypothetical protein
VPYGIAQFDPDPEANTAVGWLITIIRRHLLLHLDAAAHGTVDAVERYQQRASAGLNYLTAELADCRIDQRASEAAKTTYRGRVIEANETAVADDISVDDSNEPPTVRRSAGQVRTEPAVAHWQRLTQPTRAGTPGFCMDGCLTRLLPPDDPLLPAGPDDLHQALAFALSFDGRKRFKQSDELIARITADHLARYLAMASFVVMRRPGRGDLGGVARGAPAE